jgi:hydrogenase maturation protein HypF
MEWQDCEQATEVLRHAWTRGINCPRTSSIGRLFDGATAMLGLLSHASYEGQAPSCLEAMAAGDVEAITFPLSRRPDSIWESDWSPLLPCLQDARQSIPVRAAMFHATIAAMLVTQAQAVRADHGVSHLGLTGGVFQNRLLCERVVRDAQREGFTVHIPEKLPCNDAGLSFGQLVEAGSRA